jgi:hypothetical protein
MAADRRYVPVVQDADAGQVERRADQDFCYSAHQADVEELTAAHSPAPADIMPVQLAPQITPDWVADAPHFDQVACGWVSKIRGLVIRAGAPESAIVPLCVVVVAIVTAFGLGWLCGSTWNSFSRTAGAKTHSRTVSFSLPAMSEKRAAALITGSIGSPVGSNLSTARAESRKQSLPSAQIAATAPSTALAEQHVTAVPETRPATIDGWMVRDVYGGAAELIGPDRVWTVRPGDNVPGVGRIDSITRWGSRWIVVTISGLISSQ